MATHSLLSEQSRVHAWAVPPEPGPPESHSLLPSAREPGSVTMDASVGATAPPLMGEEAVSCLPQQPEGTKTRRRCKAHRDRIKKQLAAMERQIEANPHDVDLAAMILPSFYAESTQMQIRADFRSKLEENLNRQGNSGVPCGAVVATFSV